MVQGPKLAGYFDNNCTITKLQSKHEQLLSVENFGQVYSFLLTPEKLGENKIFDDV